MRTLNDRIADDMKDPEFAAEWNNLQEMKELGKEMAELRIEQGLSQAELAKSVDMKQANISKIEAGETSPTVRTLQRLANGLGKTLEIRFV